VKQPSALRARSNKISQQIIDSGYKMILLSTFVFLLITNFYLFFDAVPMATAGQILNVFSLLACCVATGLFLPQRSFVGSPCTARCGVALVSLSWVLMALAVFFAWGDPSPGEKILLVGFFILMLGLYAKLSLLLIGLTGLIVCYAYLLLAEPDRSAIDLAISMLKFPLLLGIFMLTVRRFLLKGQEKFVENTYLIEQLEKVSRTDHLTELANRKGFHEALETSVNNARRLRTPLALIVLDIDYFKQYNDALGHPQGDRCLRQVADILASQSKREVDTVARVGGEEFAFILPGSDKWQAEQLVYRLQGTLDQLAIAHPASSISVKVTLSLGIAEFSDGSSPEELYQRADKALYLAKQAGRNRCVVD